MRAVSSRPRLVVAIPVRDEAERIEACLTALARQKEASVDAVVLLLNNCTDATPTVVGRIAEAYPAEMVVHARDLPESEASAGVARATAMDLAADLAGPSGILLTTDADSEVAADWLAGTLRALQAGADAVAGRAVIDPAEAMLIPAALHEADARECAYAEVLDEIASLLDPDPADPWPRHTEASGASLAVRAEMYRRVGGMPRIRLGEDREFVAALMRHDARIRHAPEVWVKVSGRIDGRAQGGMADTIRRRLVAQDAFLDDRLEPAAEATRRARLRRQARRVHLGRGGVPATAALAETLGIGVEALGVLLRLPTFGAAWAAIEALAPSLRRHRVAVTHLPREMRAARLILSGLHEAARVTPGRDPADSLAAAPS